MSTPRVMAGGILVFDATAKLENAKQWAKEAKQWMQTAQHYKDQIQAYKDQLATATGLRDIQGLISQAKGVRDDIRALQKQGISLNDLIMSDSPVTGDARSLYERFKSFDNCDAKVKAVSSEYATACEKSALNKGYQLQQTLDVQKQVNRALDEISGLSTRIANSKDSKESQDLANAIQAKSIQLNSLTTSWEMNIRAAEQRDKLAEQKKRKAFREQQLDAPLPKYTPLN
ncbi:type IV secretion system protein VirB5 [Salmonella enterica]|nr:type IV secretion system protein VirB5 [Salmonella enterica]